MASFTRWKRSKDGKNLAGSYSVEGKEHVPTAGNPGHLPTVESLTYLNKKIADARVINLDEVFSVLSSESQSHTTLGKEWSKYPYEIRESRKRIEDVLPYLIYADGRFGTFLSTGAGLGIVITSPVNNKIRKQAWNRSLARKAKLESILNNEKSSNLTKYFAKSSLDLWYEGEDLANKFDEYHDTNKMSTWIGLHAGGIFGGGEGYRDRQARHEDDSKRVRDVYIPLMKEATLFAKRAKEVEGYLDESMKTALTSEQWVTKFEEKMAKAGRRYKVMTTHWRNGHGFNDDDGSNGILVTQEEYQDDTLRKTSFTKEELENAHRPWRQAYEDLKGVRKAFGLKPLIGEED